jgi:threonine synthase
MRLASTSRRSPSVSFREALLRGLAPDGGLYLPDEWPAISRDDLEAWRPLAFPELAVRLATRWLAGEFDEDVIARLVRDALDFPVPTVEVSPGRFVLELFHGPTLAFKDFGARFLARFFSHVLEEREDHATILVATSGDTGSAVAQGFFGAPRVRVVVLYPKGKVSPFQEAQMATLGGNVTAVRVEGTFDDCQRLVKTAFLDDGLAPLRLSSANSINIGRLLPQSFYYVASYLSVAPHVGDPIVFSVPTGNVGNLTAGFMAARQGLPVARFVAASNLNRAVPDYLETGAQRPRPSIATLSNAMDVGDPSNLARLVAMHGGSVERLRAMLSAHSIDEAETRATIRRVYASTGYVLDPHTSVGWAAADRELADRAEGRSRPVVVLATAHPAKFDAAIRQALGFTPPLPPAYDGWETRGLEVTDLPSADYAHFRGLLAGE